MKNKEKNIVNRINLRITDKTVLDLLTDLYASPSFQSKTDVLNRALSFGVAELYSDTFGKKGTQAEKKAESEGNKGLDLKGIRITLDQNAVTLSICEKLLTVLYNISAAEADGEELTAEFFQSGVLDQLPAHLEAEKQAMIKAEFIKRRKK